MFVIIAAFGALLILPSAVTGEGFRLGKSLEILVNLFRNISLYYVDDVDPDKLLEAAAAGMVRNLDPYTEFIPESNAENFELMTTGKYGGIGSLIRQKGDWVIFAEPYKNSPADRAGIRIGDKLLEIDGKDARGMTTQQVSDALKGEPGSTVRVTVEKLLTGEREELRIKRERIAIPGISYYGMISDSVGVICHEDFTEGCSNDMRRAVELLKAEGARSLILDYRSNGGGLLNEAVATLSLFVPRGTEVVSLRAKSEENNSSFATQSDPIDTEIPLVVLVDGNSASSAEIVAGAMQDLDRAVLIGQRTFGKGLVQTSLPVGYDAYVKVTTAKYYLPSGRCIQAVNFAADGSSAPVPDSLINEFSTRAGRKVYDGGGVKPDVELEPGYVSNYAYLVYNMGLISDFVDQYIKQHHTTLSVVPREYRFSDEAYQEFVEFMADKEVPWESLTARAVGILKDAAETERYMEGVAEEIAAIERYIGGQESKLQLYKEELINMIEGEIVLRYGYAEGATSHFLRDDKTVARAVELLHSPESYRQILSPTNVE